MDQTSSRLYTAVLLLGFNRPELARRVFEKVREQQPVRLYIAVDGPRPGNENDQHLCSAVAEIYESIDWDCRVLKLIRKENKGCRVAVAEALDWFFSQEEEGIILEDDCVPSEGFFSFCEEMLERYRHDSRVGSITGTNLQLGKCRGNASYYFSQYSQIWGWASWRRVWKNYDINLQGYTENEALHMLQQHFTDHILINCWMDVFRQLKAGQIDTWDYQFNLMGYFEHLLCVTPNTNLISNIGFGLDATHTYDVHREYENLPAGKLESPLIHPNAFVPEKEADYFFLYKDFYLEGRWRRYNKRTKKFKRWVRKLFSSE